MSKAGARNSAILREGLSGEDSDDNVGEIHLDLEVMKKRCRSGFLTGR